MYRTCTVPPCTIPSPRSTPPPPPIIGVGKPGHARIFSSSINKKIAQLIYCKTWGPSQLLLAIDHKDKAVYLTIKRERCILLRDSNWRSRGMDISYIMPHVCLYSLYACISAAGRQSWRLTFCFSDLNSSLLTNYLSCNIPFLRFHVVLQQLLAPNKYH